jgi:hypothetical protein
MKAAAPRNPMPPPTSETWVFVFTPGGFPCGPAVYTRRGTSPLAPTLADSLALPTIRAPAGRYRRAQTSRCRVHLQASLAFPRYAGKPARSVPRLAWRAPARFGDLASHGLPRQFDVRGRHHRATRQLVDDSRNAIRGYNVLTFIGSLSSPGLLWASLASLWCDRRAPARVTNASLPLCNRLFYGVWQPYDGFVPQFVQLGGLSVYLVHGVPPEPAGNSLACARGGPLFPEPASA